MSFNLKKIDGSYKLYHRSGKFYPITINELPSKTSLQSLDVAYRGQPFANVVSRFQDTRNLDTVYRGQPFYGHSDGYSINN